LVAYLLLSAAVVGGKDSAELTLVLATNGVSHPTGYPLWSVAGHAFVVLLHAVGASWEYAANAWSAVGGAVAVGFLHALSARLLPAGLSRGGVRLVALAPIALFALNPIWTVETTLAEVDSWHMAWACATAWCFVGLLRDPRPLSARRAAAWGFLCGLGAAHHLTSVFVSGTLSVFLLGALVSTRRLRSAHVTTALGAALVPLASYAWILWRAFHPAGRVWPMLEASLAGVWSHVTGAQYGHAFAGFAPTAAQAGFLRAYVYPFLAPGLASLLACAFLCRGREQRLAFRGLLAAAAVSIGFALRFTVPEPAPYFLPPMALGVAALPALGCRLLPGGARPLWMGAALVALGIALSFPWVRTGVQRNQSYGRLGDLVHSMWNAIPADSGFVLWNDDQSARLLLFQELRGEKPGLTVVVPILLTTPVPRRRFIQEHGIDPLVAGAPDTPPVGTSTGTPAVPLVDGIARSLNVQSPLPVILFDPSGPSVRLLKKPVADRLR
jgi:hypothetical protein